MTVEVKVPPLVLPLFEEMDSLLKSFIGKHPESFGQAMGRARVQSQSLPMTLAAWLMAHAEEFCVHVRAMHAHPTDNDDDVEAASLYARSIVAAYGAGLARVLEASELLDSVGVRPVGPAPIPVKTPPAPTPAFDPVSYVPGPSTLQ